MKHLIILVILTYCTQTFAQTLIVPPNPGNLTSVEHLTQSNDYVVEVKKSSDATYTPCFVYKTDNYASEARKSENSLSFTSVSFSGTSIDVRITCNFTANSVIIRPLNFGVTPVKVGNVITFTISEPRKLSIEVNNRSNPLFFFADTPDVPNTNATYYYAPGTVTNIGLKKLLNSNQSVYIAAGAIVEGSFELTSNSDNISIKGRGILCMGEWLRQSNDLTFLGNHAMISGPSHNLKIEGIILANSTGWQIPIYNRNGSYVYNNQFRNLKMISWNPNSDGIWVNGNNNIVDDCFIFNNDDAFMSHAVSNSKISNIVVWGGPWGRIYMHSGHDLKPLSENMVLENFNVIGKDGGVELILASGSSSFAQTMRNFTFKNFRIEQHPKTSSYNTNKLLNINVTGNKSISNWLLEDITIDSKNPDEGDIYGASNSLVNGVTFRNLKMNGSYVTSLTQANMDKNTYASNVNFEIVESTDVNEIMAENSMPIKASKGGIILETTNKETYKVYNSMGQELASGICDFENKFIPIKGKGIYIIKVDRKSHKIIIN